MKDKLHNLIEKIKSSRKLQILLLGFVVVVILLVYCAYFIQETKEEISDSASQVSSASTEEYITSLETKLEKVLSNIESAGRVSVAITVSSGFVYEYAYEEDGKQDVPNLLLVGGEPIIVAKTYPVISGVLVIAEGGENIKVKLDILSSIQTLLDVANEDITILSGEF